VYYHTQAARHAGATDAQIKEAVASAAETPFSRRPLSHPSRSFTGLILKGSKGSILPVRGTSLNDCYLRIAVAVVSALNVRLLANAAQTTPIGLDR
jgi:hypothetical protein